jgi:CPA2 family monovalent cation:H+ antiporter-2
MTIRGSEFSHRAAEESLPLRDAFAVLFFVSVGMLFDPQVLLDEPLRVLAVSVIILFGKTIAAVALVLAFRYPLNAALTVGASLAQIGEFSFILVSLGMSLELLPAEGSSLILAGAIISIACNSLVFSAINPLQNWLRAHSALARKLEHRADPLGELPMSTDHALLTGQVVLVGYGRVGQRISLQLTEQGISHVVVEQNREQVEKLRANNQLAVSGDATDPAVLIQAHIAHASLLVIATPDAFDALKMLEVARTLNPAIETVLRTHSEEEAALLQRESAGMVFLGENELARGMAQHVLARMGRADAGNSAH